MSCELDLVIDGSWALRYPEVPDHEPALVEVFNGVITTLVRRDTSMAEFSVPGEGVFRFTWTPGETECHAVERIADGVIVSGETTSISGEPFWGATIVGCNGRAISDEQGRFLLEGSSDGPCAIQVRHAHGAAGVATGPPVLIAPRRDGGPIEGIRLQAPDYPPYLPGEDVLERFGWTPCEAVREERALSMASIEDPPLSEEERLVGLRLLEAGPDPSLRDCLAR